jgi:hypothetical protein
MIHRIAKCHAKSKRFKTSFLLGRILNLILEKEEPGIHCRELGWSTVGWWVAVSCPH